MTTRHFRFGSEADAVRPVPGQVRCGVALRIATPIRCRTPALPCQPCKANRRGSGVGSGSGSSGKRKRSAPRKRRCARATSSISCCLAVSPRCSRGRCGRRARTPGQRCPLHRRTRKRMISPSTKRREQLFELVHRLAHALLHPRLESSVERFLRGIHLVRHQVAGGLTSGSGRTSRRRGPTPRTPPPRRRRSARCRSERRRARRENRADRGGDPGHRYRMRPDPSSRSPST